MTIANDISNGNTKVKAALETLEAGLASYKTSEDWKHMLEQISRGGRLSPLRFSFANQVLVYCAKRDATYVATFNAWKREGRFPKKGTGITILRPIIKKAVVLDKATNQEKEELKLVGFAGLVVFDIADTTGKEFKAPELPRLEDNAVAKGLVEKLTEVALSLGKDVVSKVEFVNKCHGDSKGCYYRTTCRIEVATEGRTQVEILKTLAHETAHAILHGNGEHHEKPVMEVEAESTAFVVCHALGIDTSGYSFPYVETWSGPEGDSTKVVRAVGQNITKAASKILAALVPDADPSDEEGVTN